MINKYYQSKFAWITFPAPLPLPPTVYSHLHHSFWFAKMIMMMNKKMRRRWLRVSLGISVLIFTRETNKFLIFALVTNKHRICYSFSLSFLIHSSSSFLSFTQFAYWSSMERLNFSIYYLIASLVCHVTFFTLLLPFQVTDEIQLFTLLSIIIMSYH